MAQVTWRLDSASVPRHRKSISVGADEGLPGLDGEADEETSAGKQQRQRVSLACSACRSRKSKCSGERPACKLCQRMSLECVYEIPSVAPAGMIVQKDAFCDISSRLDSIERRMSKYDAQVGIVEDEEALEPLKKKPRLENAVVDAMRLDNDQHETDTSEEEDGTDGMGISFVNEEDCGFFGPSSNIALMRHVLSAMGRRSSGIEQTMHSSSPPNLIRSQLRPDRPARQQQQPREQNAGATLPLAQESEALLQQYFSNTGLLFPYIHKQSFMETYEQLKDPRARHKVRKTWLGLLNLMMAMATYALGRKSDESSSFSSQSDQFFDRAQSLCKEQVLRGTTLETVQFLLLCCQYLQGTRMSVQTWTTHGLAVKAALSIGLHSKQASKKCSPLEQEMRKRTWYGCVVLDRHLSMTLGRPSSIPEEYNRLPLPESVPGDGDDGRGVIFFRATIELYKILGKIIGSLYGHNIGDTEEKSDMWMISQIFQLEQELNEWQGALPTEFSLRLSAAAIPTITPTDLLLERYRMILSLRFLATRLLLHRPVFVKSLTSEASNLYSVGRPINDMRRRSNTAVVRTAEDIIGIVHQILTTQEAGKKLLGAWWFSLYYVFHASLVVFGCAFIPRAEIEAGSAENRPSRISASLRTSVVALSKLDENNPLLEQCGIYTASLLQMIEKMHDSRLNGAKKMNTNPTTSRKPDRRKSSASAVQLGNTAKPNAAAVNKVRVNGTEHTDPAAPASERNAVEYPAHQDQHIISFQDGFTSVSPNDLTLPTLPTLPFDPDFDNMLELGPFFNDDLQRWLPSGVGNFIDDGSDKFKETTTA